MNLTNFLLNVGVRPKAKAFEKTTKDPISAQKKVLFEFLILEGMQAGLSWNTILQKRENFRLAFNDFDYNEISNFKETKIEELLQNSGIIRNRLKIQSVITNAYAFLVIQEKFSTFDDFIWKFVNPTKDYTKA